MDEHSVQSLGFINRLKNRLSQVNQRTAFDAFIVLLILIGLAASVYLAGQRQIFRSRASQEGSAVVLDKDGNPPPKDESGNAVVETPQIRIKIDFPTDWNTQSLLPVNSAYAQIESDPETMYCAAADGNRYEGGRIVATCTGWDNKPANSHPWCKRSVNAYFFSSCIYITAPPTSTPIPTQPPAQQTCRGTGGRCASPDAQGRGVTSEGLTCSSYMSNSILDKSCADEGTGYNYCYLNCAQPTPTRPPAAVQPTATPAPAQPTAPPPQAVTQPPQGAAQPPTATPIPEQTQWIRVSLSEQNIKSGNCFNEDTKQGTGNPDPREHCMEFSITNPYFTGRGNMVDLWLPNQPGLHTIYIGFVSNKGTLKSAPPVKVTYRPKQTTPAVGGPTASAQPTSTPQTDKNCTSDVDPNGVARFCVNRENRDKLNNVCSGGELNVGYNCPSSRPYCLIGTNVICSPKSTAQPTTQPTPTSKPLTQLTTCATLFEDCMRIYGAETPEFDKCSLMKTQCELTKTGRTPPTPTPTPTLIPPSKEEATLCVNVLSACLGDAGSDAKGTQTRCNSIFNYCINGQGYENQNQLWKILSNECRQQEQECRDSFITGFLFGGNCSAKRNSCDVRIQSLHLK